MIRNCMGRNGSTSAWGKTPCQKSFQPRFRPRRRLFARRRLREGFSLRVVSNDRNTAVSTSSVQEAPGTSRGGSQEPEAVRRTPRNRYPSVFRVRTFRVTFHLSWKRRCSPRNGREQVVVSDRFTTERITHSLVGPLVQTVGSKWSFLLDETREEERAGVVSIRSQLGRGLVWQVACDIRKPREFLRHQELKPCPKTSVLRSPNRPGSVMTDWTGTHGTWGRFVPPHHVKRFATSVQKGGSRDRGTGECDLSR